MQFLQRLPSAFWFLAHGAVTSVIGNISLAVLSVALAGSLWLFVTDRENPTEVQTFNSAIPIKFVNVPNDLAVANASETAVRVRIEAPKSDLNNLRTDQFQATVDLGGNQKGAVTAAIEVAPPNGRISVVEVTPPRIDVTLESLRSKEVPVHVALVGSPQQGFAAVGESSNPQTVTVTGPESLVALVDSVAAEINLTGLRVDVTEDRAELKPEDVRGGEISRVKANPATARVSVDLEQREFSLEFVVNPQIGGGPAAGYNVEGVAVDPRLVTVAGPLDVLQSIDAVRGISTEEIALTDARSDIIRQVQLVLPQGVRVLSAVGVPVSGVRVTVTVRPAKGEATFRVPAQVRNVEAGLTVTEAGPVDVTLAGDVPVLQAVTPESIVVVADAARLSAGLHALPLLITPPAGTTLARSDPAELGVALVAR